MKIHIELDDTLTEEEVIIRCAQVNDRVHALHRSLLDAASLTKSLALFQGSAEFFLPTAELMFFETQGDRVFAHTSSEVYEVHKRLYELEALLPRCFVRVSKSTIANTHHILSLERNLTASSLVCFQKSHKQVYASRAYYKQLRLRLDERSFPS